MQPSRLHGLLPVRRDVVGEVVGVICKPGSVLPPSQPEDPAATNCRCRTASLPCQKHASLFHRWSDSAYQGNTTCSQHQPNGSAFIHCFLTCSSTRIVRTSCNISTMLTYPFRLRIFMPAHTIILNNNLNCISGNYWRSHSGSDGIFLRALNFSIKLNSIVANVIAVPAIHPNTKTLFKW